MAFQPKLKSIIDIPMLRKIISACNLFPNPILFQTVYLVAFFSFLRISNFCPHVASDYDHLKHLAQGDVLFDSKNIVLLIKWSKTIKFGKSVKLLHIPCLENDICPVLAVKSLLKTYKFQSNDPLFQIKVGNLWLPLTDVKIRKHFSKILKHLNLQDSNLTFHSFRRSGATFAFNHNVHIQNIKNHGTWSSDCVWRYITDSVDTGRQVASMFQRELC